MKKNLNLLDIISILWKSRKRLLTVVGLCTLGALIATLMMDNYYKATTSFYAASPDLAKPIGTAADINVYGGELDQNRLFSIANSHELADYLIQKYNLTNHYEIDSSGVDAYLNTKKRLDKLYSTGKTDYGAIKISIEDTDKELAAHLANDARDRINVIAQKLIKNSQQNIINSIESTFAQREKYLQSLNDSVATLRKQYEIFHLGQQGEVLTKEYAEAQERKNLMTSKINALINDPRYQDSLALWRANLVAYNKDLADMDKRMSTFNDGHARIVALDMEQRNYSAQLTGDKARHERLLSSYNNEFTALHLIEPAIVPLEKSRPKRSIYLITAVLLSFFLTSAVILLLESTKNVKWKKVLNG